MHCARRPSLQDCSVLTYAIEPMQTVKKSLTLTFDLLTSESVHAEAKMWVLWVVNYVTKSGV